MNYTHILKHYNHSNHNNSRDHTTTSIISQTSIILGFLIFIGCYSMLYISSKIMMKKKN